VFILANSSRPLSLRNNCQVKGNRKKQRGNNSAKWLTGHWSRFPRDADLFSPGMTNFQLEIRSSTGDTVWNRASIEDTVWIRASIAETVWIRASIAETVWNRASIEDAVWIRASIAETVWIRASA
jgi:ribosomal protein L31E